jgi:outer membrane protein assembly factor BamB
MSYAADGLFAIDIDDVRKRWQKDSPSVFGARPALVDGVLVTSDAGDSQTLPSDRSIVYGLDPATGETYWRTKVDEDSLVSPVAVSAGRGIAVLAGRYGMVAAFDVASGEETWRVSVEKGGNVPMRPLVRDGRVFVSSRSEGTHAFDVASGDRQWSVRSREAAKAGRHLGFIDGRVVASTRTTAYELDPASGVVFASHSLSPERVRNTNVAIANGWLYYATGDSQVSRIPVER